MDQDRQAATDSSKGEEIEAAENDLVNPPRTVQEEIAEEDDSILHWEDVESYAKDWFNVWWDGSELKWAEVAWQHIVAAGYAEGEHGKEHCQACLRFLALVTLYADWCTIATDEEPEPDVKDYAEALEVNPFYMGLLLGPDYEFEGEDQYDCFDDEVALTNAVRELVRRERPIVAEALLEGFGGPSGLFVSLWRTQYPAIEQDTKQVEKAPDSTAAATVGEAGATPGGQLQLLGENSDVDENEDEDEDDEYDEDDDYCYPTRVPDSEILNDVTAENIEAWEWVNDDCPPLDE